MITVVWLVANYHDVICNDEYLLDLAKAFISLCWNTSPTTVDPNDITVYWNLPSSVLNIVKKEEASSRCDLLVKGLLGCDTRIVQYCQTHLTNLQKSVPCLGTIPLQLDTVDPSDSFLDTCTLIWDLVFFGWSALLVIRLALGGR